MAARNAQGYLRDRDILKTNGEKSMDFSYSEMVSQSFFPSYVGSKRPIFSLNVSEKACSEIESLVRAKPFTTVPYENMKNTQFKVDFLDKRTGHFTDYIKFSMEKMERDSLIDQELLVDYKEKQNNPEFLKMYQQRSKLPAFNMRQRIVDLVKENQVVLFSGDTGCGKTTQVPQYILDDFITSGNGSMCKIICTQPRRISAISVGARVAAERAEVEGLSAGHQIRDQKILPRKRGSIVYVTNGIVLRFMESNPALNDITHLILDEIHERDIYTDFRLTYPVQEFFLDHVIERLGYAYGPPSKNSADSLRRNEKSFKERVLPYVQSTFAHGKFNLYCQLIKPHSEELCLDLIARLTKDICRTEKEGSILIFVAGFEDIRILKNDHFYDMPRERYIIITLHSQIPMDKQKEVFDEAPRGMRKIIIATNIAETSITIDDVVFVIDSGWAKVKTYDARIKAETLDMKFISKANAVQRKGRAGRTRPGKCFRLYTRGRFDAFFDYAKPEILRIRLESIILQSKLLGFRNIDEFLNSLLDTPKPQIIDRSMELLRTIGAFEDGEMLSPLGYYLAKLPMNPQLGKMLLFGVFFRCLEPVLNVVVGLDHKSPFNPDMGRNRQLGDMRMAAFSEGCKSDHLLLYKALYLYTETKRSEREKLCETHNLNAETMGMLESLRKNVMECLNEMGLIGTKNSQDASLNVYSRNLELVKAIIGASLYPNITVGSNVGIKRRFITLDGTEMLMHKKSVLFNEHLYSITLFAFYNKLKLGQYDMMHDVTMVPPFAVYFFGDSGGVGSTLFSGQTTTLESLKRLFKEFVIFKMTNPGLIDLELSQNEAKLLEVMVPLLSGLRQNYTASEVSGKKTVSNFGDHQLPGILSGLNLKEQSSTTLRKKLSDLKFEEQSIPTLRKMLSDKLEEQSSTSLERKLSDRKLKERSPTFLEEMSFGSKSVEQPSTVSGRKFSASKLEEEPSTVVRHKLSHLRLREHASAVWERTSSLRSLGERCTTPPGLKQQPSTSPAMSAVQLHSSSSKERSKVAKQNYHPQSRRSRSYYEHLFDNHHVGYAEYTDHDFWHDPNPNYDHLLDDFWDDPNPNYDHLLDDM